MANKKIQERDAARRYARRGVARAVLENSGNSQYMDSHPIAAEYDNSYSKKKLNRWATEKDTNNSTGTKVFHVNADGPKAALWPK